MSGDRAYRHGLHVALVALACAAVVASAGCARRGPPAPLDDRTGVYYAAPARPKAAHTTTQAVPPPRAPAVERAPLAASPDSAPVESAQAPLPATGSIATSRGGTVRVRAGDTLFAVARRENVPVRALIDANSLAPPYRLLEGQTLRVPGVRVYTVAAGDTVYGIARRFDVGIHDLIRQNGLAAPDFALYVGQSLVLPGEPAAATTAAAPSVSASPPSSSQTAPSTQTAIVRPPAAPAGDPNATPPPRGGQTFLWPLRGKVISTYGAKGGGLYNDGVNIAAPEGTIVRAAENGVVAYAGNELRGYGNLLLVRHADGWITAYAHNSELLVSRGQVVRRGQPIARVGSTGAVATPQLHFEIRRGRKAVDPRPHLG